MRQMITSLIAALFAVVRLAPADAESASEAIKTFGLLGSWAVNCAADPKTLEGARLAFSTPFLGSPTVELAGVTRSIHSAARVTEEKIKIEVDISPEELEANKKIGSNVATKAGIFTKRDGKLLVSSGNGVFEMETVRGIMIFSCASNKEKCPNIYQGPLDVLEHCLN